MTTLTVAVVAGPPVAQAGWSPAELSLMEGRPTK